VNRRTMLRLYGNAELTRYIEGQARRHFYMLEDQQDAVGATWLAFIECSECGDPRDFARRFIHRYYMRKWRLRKHEC
jgi:hypothetical protein